MSPVGQYSMFNVQFISLESVSDGVISDGNVLCPFTAGLLTVFLDKNCTLVVLIENCVFGIVSLTIQEIILPQNVRHQVDNRNQFCLCRALCVHLMFDGSADYLSLSQQHGSTCLTAHVCMHSI